MRFDQSLRRGVATVVLVTVALTAVFTGMAAFVGINMLGVTVWQSLVAALGQQKVVAFTGTIVSGGTFLAIVGLIYWYASQKEPTNKPPVDA